MEDCEQSNDQNNQRTPRTTPERRRDEGNIGYGIIGFCVPVAGLVLYLVWREERPEDSKYAGMGALINVIVSFGIPILLFIVYFIIIVVFGIIFGVAA